MDLMAVDVGNTRVGLGVFVEDHLEQVERFDMGASSEWADSLRKTLRQMRQLCGEQPLGARTVPVVASSVNEAALAVVREAVGAVLDQNVLVIGQEVPLDVKLGVENPESVGSDRLLTASAAYAVVGDAVVVADFGTATTIDCVDHYGIFLGGAILPGLALAAESLAKHTASLPHVEVKAPAGAYGKNTIEAIQYGVYHGAIGALRGIVERYATQLGRWPQLVVTGGYGAMIAAGCDFVDSVVPDLCLDGIFWAYKKHRAALEQETQTDLDSLEEQLGLDKARGAEDNS